MKNNIKKNIKSACVVRYYFQVCPLISSYLNLVCCDKGQQKMMKLTH